MIKTDCLIVGSGPAGLTAAIYQVRANIKTIIIAGNQPGGQLTTTTRVENWPGYPDGVDGIPLMMDMQKQAQNLGAELKYDLVTGITTPDPLDTGTKAENNFIVKLQSGEEIICKVVIVTTGAAARWLDIGEKNFIGKGVSACATCDGAFFREKVVAVVGGGDTAVEEASFLTRFASKVYMIHRRDSFRAKQKEQERVLNNPKIQILWNTQTTGVGGTEKVEKVFLKNTIDNSESELMVNGLFVAIGGVPATGFLDVEKDTEGHVIVGKDIEYPFMTSTGGIFAAGDCVDPHYKQAITSAGDGCKAALDSQKWLENQT